MTYLLLSNTAWHGNIYTYYKWSTLVSLQVLSIKGRTHFDEHLCDLAMLSSVEVDILCTQQCSKHMILQVGRLGHKLGVARLDVKCCLT